MLLQSTRRKAVTTVVIAAAVLVTLGVGSGGGRAYGATHANTTLHIWYGADDPSQVSSFPHLVPIFEAAHPNIKVDLTIYGVDDFDSLMQTAISSGHGVPDLAYATPRAPGIPSYVVHGKLMNLTGYAEKHKWATLLRPGLLHSWNAPFATWIAREDHRKLGPVQIYGVPDEMATTGFMYNEHLLKTLHLSVPTTVSQLQSDAAVAKGHGYTAIGIGNADLWVGDDMFLSLVNDRLSSDYLKRALAGGSSFTYRNKAFTSAASTLASWAKHGYFTSGYPGVDAQDAITSFFTQGKTVFQYISSTQFWQVRAREHSRSIGFIPFPPIQRGGRSSMLYGGYEGWIIPKVSTQPAAAETWINFIVSSKATSFFLNHGIVPAAATTPADAPTSWQRAWFKLVNKYGHGIYIDNAPIPMLNAAEEGNVAQLLARSETPTDLSVNLEKCYSSLGKVCKNAQDFNGEF